MGLPLFKTPTGDTQDENTLEVEEQLRRLADAPPHDRPRTAIGPEQQTFLARMEAHALRLRNENSLRDMIGTPEEQPSAAIIDPFVMVTDRTLGDIPESEFPNQEPAGGIRDIHIPTQLREQTVMLGERVAALIRQELGRQHDQRDEESTATLVTNDDDRATANSHDSGEQSATSHPMDATNVSSFNGHFVEDNPNRLSLWTSDLSPYVLPFTPMTQVEPLIESLSIALAPEPVPEPHYVDRAATPPIRSAAPSPQPVIGYVRSPDLHEHHPNCPCIDCWTSPRL
ncbi:hypothetical protein IFR05_010659 [Cadophora sp. M221]|nr:hypothetical protein IFR05_010659 [Cadophora sp. M221]